jgi:PKD repeat protein
MKTGKWLKKSIKLLGALLITGALLFPSPALSQSIPAQTPAPSAQIDVNSSARAGKNVIFDASKSTVPGDPAKITYHWDFGDGTGKDGINVTHTYGKTGTYHAALQITSDKQTLKDNADIFIYKKSILFLTDESDQTGQIQNLKLLAQNDGVEMNILESFDSASEFISEEALTKAMDENLDALQRSDEIILWTHDNVGLNTLNRFIQENEDLNTKILNQKNLFIIDNDIEKIMFTPSVTAFNPQQIIVTKESSLYAIVPSDESGVIKALQQGGYEYKFIDEASRQLSFLNFMSYFVNFLVESGIPDNTIILILMLPIIATVIVFMRQVIGMNTFGMYTPLIICLTFLILGLKFGLITLVISLAVGLATRFALKKVHLLFMSKLSIMMIMLTLAIFALLIGGTWFKLFDSDFVSLAIFPMLILASMTEKFTSIQSEVGFWQTLWLTAQTIIIAIVGYFIVGGSIDLGFFSFQWDFLRNFIRHYPEAIFIFLIIDIGLGKWTELRLVEYMRFREIFQHNEEE